MKQTLKEQIKKIIEGNEIFITIDDISNDKNVYKDNNTVDIEIKEYLENKEKYENSFLNVSFVNKDDFNKIQDIEPELIEKLKEYFYKITNKEKFKNEDDLNNHINSIVEEHMKLYNTEEMQNYIKDLLDI